MSLLLQGISKYLNKEELEKIGAITVGIIGAGGLGSNLALMLSRCGFRKFVVADFDLVESSNLNRQYYLPQDIGKLKVNCLREKVESLDSTIEFKVIPEEITAANFAPYFSPCQVIVEAVDKGEVKALLYKVFKEEFGHTNKVLIMASGLAGYGLNLSMDREIIGKNIYLVGDKSTSITQSHPLAPRVQMAAALQGDTVLAAVLGEEDPRRKHMNNFFATPVYCLTDSKSSLGRSTVEVVEEMLKGGAKFIQYREKDKSLKEKYEEAIAIRNLTSKYGATFIVNDHLDLALGVKADGVHLGQEDLPPTVARRLLGRNKILGLSTHNEEQYKQVVELNKRAKALGDLPVVDYIGMGPVFATKTKVDVVDPVGLAYPQYGVKNQAIPLVAIGGIKIHNLPQVLALGVETVAMVTEITGAKDIQKIIKEVAEIRRLYLSEKLNRK